jgi:hypothetical protein
MMPAGAKAVRHGRILRLIALRGRPVSRNWLSKILENGKLSLEIR